MQLGLLISVSGLVSGVALFSRVRTLEQSRLDDRTEPLSVIIPARDEEHRLPRLLASLNSERLPGDEVIVVDDGSQDATAKLAMEYGARVISGKRLPSGWVGKAWACHQGAAAARHSLLLFLDADTWFAGRGLGKLVHGLAERGVISVQPYHVMEDAYEQLSLFFNVITMASTGAFSLLGDRVEPRGLFGPALLVRKEEYQAAGGHKSVKDRVLENLFLAENFRRQGIVATVAGGRSGLNYRMYAGGLAEMTAGWGKAFIDGARRSSLPITTLISLWIAGSIQAVVGLAFGAHGVSRSFSVLLYAFYALHLAVLGERIGRFRWWTAVLYPIALAYFLAVFGCSGLRKFTGRSARWRGREITTDAS